MALATDLLISRSKNNSSEEAKCRASYANDMGVSTVRNFGTVIDQDLASTNIMLSEYPFPALTGLEGELKYDPSDKGKLPKRAIRSFLDTVTSNAHSWKVEANLTGFSDKLPITYPTLASYLNGGDTS